MMSGSDILFTTVHVITDWPISVPLAASAVDHRVPVSDSPPAPGDRRVSLMGERSVCK
ncbi:unnamed protein product [Staurois parvus]|uniref:Uncharacterized protein n=1 Tax=Staurois parvus TaxID=386267 RepID=A0ABN9D070_9NEOB|nr:unnamed protein product [Staurois parvus]